VEVRLTPDIIRGFTLEEAIETVRYAAKYRDRGVLGVGLGGMEAEYPPEPYEPAFTLARDLGLASVPHAGEVAGPPSVRGALDALGADRLRHGIRAAEDSGLLREIASRRIVLDVCPISNLRTRVVSALEEHPLPQLLAAGAICSISTDDPAMFGTDLSRDYDAALSLGLDPRGIYEAGLEGALCDEQCRERLQMIGERYDWEALP
jgi:aminodeoxyfutalosine deaminase